MSTKFTRRRLAGLLSAAPLLAQAPPQTSAPDDTTAARDLIKNNIDVIRKFDLPVATEPGFIFKP